ncbi:hypothetical protein BD410DRAFT_841150 [Rickenella mellea]|uniref:Sacsin/Nov domain-containing protein n=1 Tax=Rickenella mellea TaxID=50990 RepID=A0A4Y7PZ94_9AGAM|nr:hypothetical protein BD410DRAFT_841150 [Rickenella mellea]
MLGERGTVSNAALLMFNARRSLWESGRDESVEVNQRALIDKVLARYSGEFTVFRELLQNSDDAASKAAEIHFETRSFSEGKGNARKELPELRTEKIHQWTFKNNGSVFNDKDWNRLKKIADGNPDEGKIGAFGVGFYSLFSITEKPFVKSGRQWMGFYWKDNQDQLFARRGVCSTPEQWTSFELPLREPAPIPNAFDLTRFLASSITFMVHLRSVSVFFNGVLLACLEKEAGNPKKLEIPRQMTTKSSVGIMKVSTIKHTPLQIKAQVVKAVYTSALPNPMARRTLIRRMGFARSFKPSFFASTAAGPQTCMPSTDAGGDGQPDDANPLSLKEMTLNLTIYSAEVNVNLPQKISQELFRAMQKKPPSSLRLDLIYTGKMEYDHSEDTYGVSQNTGSIFQGLRADLDGSGLTKIFIGHATGQTTGLGGHISARFIPTVERESIDLVDPNVTVWNKELLFVGGFLARVVYDLELDAVRGLWQSESMSRSLADQQMQAELRDRAIHALRFFTFYPTTPSAVVSNVLEAEFFTSGGEKPFWIVSSVGIREAKDVRIPDLAFKGFIKQIPVLPESAVSSAPIMIETLKSRNVLKDLTFSDVLCELRSRALSETELVECMRWWISVQKSPEKLEQSIPQIRQQLLAAASLEVFSESSQKTIIRLANVRTFIDTRSTGSLILADGPLPIHTLLPSITRYFVPNDLVVAFGWQALTVVEWVRHLASPGVAQAEPRFQVTASDWMQRVLNSLARAWPSMTQVHKTEIVEILKNKSCISTTGGMTVPREAYFPSANIFPDLPVVSLAVPVRGTLEAVLQALGVRKHVNIQIVFDKMTKGGNWTISDVTKYLATVQQSLSSEEVEHLRQMAAFPKASQIPEDKRQVNVNLVARFKASDLYEPLDVFRKLKLPVIDWGERPKWAASSKEAKFLFLLGLRQFPPLLDILRLASSVDADLSSTALHYFLNNTSRYPHYDPTNVKYPPFVPACKANNDLIMSSPDDVFTNRAYSNFGFKFVHPSLSPRDIGKLRLRENPPISLIIPMLENGPPKTIPLARQWFEALASRLSELKSEDILKLSLLPIVPFQSEASLYQGEQLRMMAPKKCYFRMTSSPNTHSKLFAFVDFGAAANRFLRHCGAKSEPSVEEIVEMMLSNARLFYRAADGAEGYLMELRNIAVNHRVLSLALRIRMKNAAILLGIKRTRKDGPGHGKAHMALDSSRHSAKWTWEDDLLRPHQIVVVDDMHAYDLFGDLIFSAPREDLLEEFYKELGSPRLSALVQEEYQTTGEPRDAKVGKDMRALVLERLPLFFHEKDPAQVRIKYSWLENHDNFIVKTFRNVTVLKRLQFVNIHEVRKTDVTAAVKRIGQGAVNLLLAGDSGAAIDHYDVASSLCGVLLATPTTADAMLLETLLTTDLCKLQRRGYDGGLSFISQQRIIAEWFGKVERILKQKTDEHERILREMKSMETLASHDDRWSMGGTESMHTSSTPISPTTKPLPTFPSFK